MVREITPAQGFLLAHLKFESFMVHDFSDKLVTSYKVNQMFLLRIFLQDINTVKLHFLTAVEKGAHVQ